MGTVQINKITNTIDTFNLYSNVVIMVVIVLLNVIQQNNIVSAIHKLYHVDVDLKRIGISINYKKPRNIIFGKHFYCLVLKQIFT